MSNDLELTDLHKLMLRNAEKIRHLYSRIKTTVHDRDKSPEKLLEWRQSCAEFHSSYDVLVFPGGWNALESIESGDEAAMEAAICYLECRPYFHRSGYLFKIILKRAKRAPLSDQQRIRLQRVIDKRDEWRRNLPALLRTKAEQGDRDAQRKLGELYSSGYKYSQDLKFNMQQALKWFRAAAEQGDAKAQRELASHYAWCNPPNWAESYFWLGIAAKYEDGYVEKKIIADDRRKAADELLPEQKTEIDRRVAEWKPTTAFVCKSWSLFPQTNL